VFPIPRVAGNILCDVPVDNFSALKEIPWQRLSRQEKLEFLELI
jgi:hypothetical protein